MMPGENHSKIAGVASDATTGTCQNCTVLQQNLDEYIAALLSLKQKIIDSDHLLTEYEEKCDELQRCQRETSVLHQQLDELLDKMVVLEKQNDRCEMIQAELQEKKSIIHKLEQKCVTMDALKEENVKAVTLNVNLGNQLKKLEETSTSQNNENAILKSEKEALEKELQEAQNSAKLYEQAAAEVQRLKEENTRTLTLKESAETQLQIFKDSRLRQIREIEQLKLDKETLKRRLHKTQKHLEKLERESQKDVRNASAQTNHSREQTVDKAKVRSLLEDLWKCVEPQSTQTTNFSLFCEENVKHDYDGCPKEVPGSPLQRQNPQPVSKRTPTKSVNTSAVPPATKGTGAEEKVSRKRRRSRSSGEQLAGSVAMDETMWPAVQENDSLPSRLSPALKVARQEMEGFNTEQLLDWLKPLPPPLSPISSPCSKESVLGHVSDSSDDEEDESTDRKMISAEMPNVGVFLNRDEFGTNSSVDQNVDSRVKSCAEIPLLPSERDMMGSLATSSCTPSVQVCLSTEREPFRSDSVDVGDLETPNAQGATRLTLTLQQDKEPKEVQTPCEDSLPVLKVRALEDHRGRPGITPSPSAPELCQSGCAEDKVYMNSSNADPAEEGAMDVQTPLDVSNVIKEPPLVDSGQSAGLSEGGTETFASKSVNEEPRKESDSTLDDGGVEVLKPNDQETLSNSRLENKDGIHFSEHTPIDISEPNFVEGSILSNTAPLLKEEMADCHQMTLNITAREIQNSFTSPVPFNNKGSPGSKVSDMEIDCGGSELSANGNGSEKCHLTKNGKTNEQGDTLQLFEPECLLNTAVSARTSDTNGSAEAQGKGSDDSVTRRGKTPDTPDLPVVRLSVGCVTEDSDSSEESSDEQESCKLQRKVRRMCQRGSSQGPVGKRDILSETVTDCKSSHAGCKDLQDIACKQPLNKELVSTRTHADTLKGNVDLKIEEDLEDGGIKIVKCESVSVEGYDCEMVTVSETLNVAKLNDQKIKDEVPLQSFEMEEQTSFTNANPEGFLRPSPVSENTDEKTDTCKIIEKTETIIGGECPIDVAQTEAFKHESLPGHAWQCSGKVQEDLKANVNDQESVLESNVLSASGSLKLKSPECLTKVRSEMGPPLPPLLMPLSATPKRPHTLDSRSFPGKLSFSSPTNELSSPQKGNSISAVPSPDGSSAQGRSPSMAAKSPSDTKCGRTLSSPLQFCSATPKHAVPVPGRFPTSALGSSVTPSGATHENSVRILDTMYPELSARARTLNILRGNVNLGRPAPENGTAAPGTVNQITGYKSINSSSTAFTKTGKSCESESGSPEGELTGEVKANDPSAPRVGKRTGVNVTLPSSAKKLQLEGDSPPPVGVIDTIQPLADSVASEVPKEGLQPKCSEDDNKQLDVTSVSTVDIISKALTQIETSCFDLLPVIKSHVSIRRISTVPILRDEERDIICQFSEVNKTLADDFLSAILAKMKTEKKSLGGDHLQALCRVYTGICRQKGEWQRVHLLVYSILKEDFPDSAKLVLFIVTTWYNVLLPQLGVVCNAIHAVLRKRAEGEVLQYLTAYLSWETNPPCDVQKIIMNALVALQLGTNMKFQHHERHGSDLNQAAWDYIFAMDLLCNQMRWTWTYDNLICKELWPVMNKWVTQQRTDMTVQDVSVASVLRLIGRLGQLGIKEKHLASVRNVAKVINTFGRHGKSEGVPWEVQLAAVYTVYDLSPSNPKEALEALAAWRGETTVAVPPAVTSCITQIGSICRQVKP